MPPVPGPHTIHSGTGCGSCAICLKIDSAMLLLARQSVARSAWVNWSMKWPPVSRASRADSALIVQALSTRWQRPPWNSIAAIFSGEVEAGITAMKGRSSNRAK